jgi:hypothetical protein
MQQRKPCKSQTTKVMDLQISKNWKWRWQKKDQGTWGNERESRFNLSSSLCVTFSCNSNDQHLLLFL